MGLSAVVFAAALPAFLGLAVVLPVLGHTICRSGSVKYFDIMFQWEI